MIKVLIIEDEDSAADRLKNMLEKISSPVQVTDRTDSIQESVKWLQQHEAPDLIFMDIHLADGSSFEIFRKVNVTAPVIFITAYDEYAIQAFKVNSIDYLLKPVKKTELEAAIQKFVKLKPAPPSYEIGKLLESVNREKQTFQKRMVVRIGQNIRLVEVADIAYFYTVERVNFLCTYDGNKLPIDHKLDELEQLLDPDVFFRINRQFIVNIKAIDKLYTYSKGRVKVTLIPPCPIETIVSTERSALFKSWLPGK